jgi:hypothetical protein
MAGELSLSELNLLINAGIKINGAKEITPPIHNNIEKKISLSSLNKKDGGTIEALVSYISELTLTDRKNLAYKGYVDDEISSIDLSTLWNKSGNTLASHGTFGSTSGAFGWDYQRNGTVVGGLGDTTGWYWGGSAAFASTDHSFYGTGNTSASYIWQAQNNGNSQRAWLRGDGLFTATGGLSTDGILSAIFNTTNDVYSIGKQVGTSGSYNVYIGRLVANGGSGDNNTIVGDASGISQTASGVTLLGQNVGNSNTGQALCSIGQFSGINNTGVFCNFSGTSSGRDNTATYVKAIGTNSARDNNIGDIFTVSEVQQIFWNNVGNKGYSTLQSVTQQTAMSEDGTNTSASASVFKIAHARGTGNALPGIAVIQKANVQASGTTRHTLTDWWYFDVDGNTGIGGNSYGSGVGVMFMANAGTDASANPTGGVILQAKSGRMKVMETDGSLSWLVKAASATKTTAAAPYTNDGYIEVVIDGTTFKLMTTA